MRNAILGHVHARQPSDAFAPYFRAFLCSALHRTLADIFIFASPESFVQKLKRATQNATRIHILRSQHDGSVLQHARYSSYLQLLSSHNFTKVALADAFDTVFESNIFDTVQDGLYISEEWPAMYSLGTERSNKIWVSVLYGNDMLKSLHKFPVICSGFTAGSKRAIEVYLHRMVEQTTERLPIDTYKKLVQKFGMDMARGFDQGVHNVLIRSMWNPVDGAISTLNVLTANGQRCDDSGIVKWNSSTGRACRPTGRCYDVLHQYGRLKPNNCKWQVRLGLTCKNTSTGNLPSYCDPCNDMLPAAMWV